MKKFLFVLVFSLIPLLSFAADPITIDKNHSNIEFSVKHLMISTVKGNFSDYSGTILYDEKNPALNQVNFVVKAQSINTSNAKRDEHLRSADFFDVTKFPEAKFVSTKISSSGNNTYKMEGNLQIKGVTKKVLFDVSYLGKAKDPMGVEKIAFSATTTISRKDFGITYNKVLEAGGVTIGDEVKLNIDIQAIVKK